MRSFVLHVQCINKSFARCRLVSIGVLINVNRFIQESDLDKEIDLRQQQKTDDFIPKIIKKQKKSSSVNIGEHFANGK